MEQFSLEKWLQDKSRKIITRRGNSVRIICTDCKSSALPIIAEIQNPKTNTWFIDFFNVDGTTEIDKQKQRDLFFADEEEELTEFEKVVQSMLNEPHFQDIEAVKQFSKTLLNLARKELLKDFMEKACEWLEDTQIENFICRDDGIYFENEKFVEQFKNYMQNE